MKLRSFAYKSIRLIFWIIFALILLVAAVLRFAYSPWVQDRAKERVLAAFNSKPGTELKVDSLSLKFPLNLKATGVMLVQDGDTMVQADNVKANVALMPLLAGEVDVKDLFLAKARYQMGNPDSAMMIVITADTLDIKPAHIRLAPLGINIDDARIAHGKVALSSRIDTTSTEATESQPLTIRAKRLRLEDFTYAMTMPPTVDSLGATIGNGQILDALIDLKKQIVQAKSFTGSNLDAAYIAPAVTPDTPITPPSDSIPEPAPWTVTIDSISFVKSRGLYALRGHEPLPGLDFAYIQADSMDIAVKNFYNQATTISLPITLSATERCGVRLDASGTFSMDSTGMRFQNFVVSTPANTLLTADGMMGVGSIMDDPSLPLALKARGRIADSDLRLMFPPFAPYLAGVRNPLTLDVDINGSLDDLSIGTFDIGISNIAKINAHGNVQHAMDAKSINGHLALDGQIFDTEAITKSMAGATDIKVPPMRLHGAVDMRRGDIKGHLQANTLHGKIALEAAINARSQAYDATIATDNFPVNAFMPAMGIGNATISAQAKGHGFDFLSPKTQAHANINATSVLYNNYDYKGITLDANLEDGKAVVSAKSKNEDVDVDIDAHGNLDGDTYNWDLAINGSHIDLKAINMAKEETEVAVSLTAQAQYTPASGDISALAVLRSFDMKMPDAEYNITDVRANFLATDSSMQASVTNRDLNAWANAECGLKNMGADMLALSAEAKRQIKERVVHIDSLQPLLPKFQLSIGAGSNNFINDILSQSDMNIQRLDLHAENDSTLNVMGKLLSLSTKTMRIDTISLRANQADDRMHMVLQADNRPGNLDEWAHLRLDALLNPNQVTLRASQQNYQMQTGYDIGMLASMTDSTVTARVFPFTPTIGYQKWNVNLDNYITYFPESKKIQANLKMKSDISSLAIYTQAPTDSVALSNGRDDLVLNISDIRIQDWISFNPFAPPISGSLSTNMVVSWDGGKDINAHGVATFADFMYNKERVGTFTSNINVETNTAGAIRAQADLNIDGQQAVTLAGCLNDSTTTSPFNLDLALIKFPLSIANPFLPADMARLTGTLNGSMDVSGDAKQPLLNGEIYFDKAAVKVGLTNTSYAFSDVKIPMVNNIVSFKDFGIKGAGDSQLLINGQVDMSAIASPHYDLSMKADNFMVVNSNSAAKNAMLYGKGYLNLDATVKGNMRYMMLNANATILSGTNVTVVPAFTANTLQAPAENDMVKFVNFNDSTAVVSADSTAQTGIAMIIDANLSIQNATTITVDLPSSTRDRVVVQPQGDINYTQNPLSDPRVTGRISLNGGYARYTIPVIGAEKSFTFDPSSYVAFNGNMMNPIINIKAIDDVKANVTQEGQNSRLVNFDIILAVTGSLEQMDVKFDLSTNDDLTVANELQGMTPEQRASQAMNLLLYNVYTGPGTKGNANLAANPLFSFLESQVNNWAANNIKGVDLTFGIDQYNQTTNGTTSSTMTYSYQVSKSLFDDRFKIVVGGNYSTNDNPDENLSENLINDISFEYYLNKQQTMLLKLFRHTGYESILEGEITQTGVGFVYKRKLNHLSQIMPRFLRPKRHKKIE